MPESAEDLRGTYGLSKNQFHVVQASRASRLAGFVLSLGFGVLGLGFWRLRRNPFLEAPGSLSEGAWGLGFPWRRWRSVDDPCAVGPLNSKLNLLYDKANAGRLQSSRYIRGNNINANIEDTGRWRAKENKRVKMLNEQGF